MPPRVLFLHGFTQSASVFNKKLGALRKAFKQAGIDAVFADGPLIVQAATASGGSLAQYDADDADGDEPPRAWWQARDNADGSRTYRGVDDSLRMLRDLLERERIDGVFGFSQGAALAALLCVACRHPDVHPAFDGYARGPLRFGCFVGGFPAIDPALMHFWARGPEPTPSLHVIGRGDTLVGEDRSGPLIEVFADPRVERHDGGHFVPSSSGWRNFFVDWVNSFDADIEVKRAISSPGAPRL